MTVMWPRSEMGRGIKGKKRKEIGKQGERVGRKERRREERKERLREIGREGGRE